MSEHENRKLNWRQACALLGCGRSKFYDLVNAGELPAYRSGKRGLFVYERDVKSLVLPVSSDAPQLFEKSFVR